MKFILFIAVLGACGSDNEKSAEEKNPEQKMVSAKAEAGLRFAREHLKELKTRLASEDPGSASSICAVIKPDMPAIEKADKELAETLKRHCGRDMAIRGLERFVEKAEAAHAKDPSDTFLLECSSFSVYNKSVVREGLDAEPEVVVLGTRFDVVCPGKR